MSAADVATAGWWRGEITTSVHVAGRAAALAGIDFYECHNSVWLVEVPIPLVFILGIQPIETPMPSYPQLEELSLEQGTTLRQMSHFPPGPAMLPPTACTCADVPPLRAGALCSRCGLIRVPGAGRQGVLFDGQVNWPSPPPPWSRTKTTPVAAPQGQPTSGGAQS